MPEIRSEVKEVEVDYLCPRCNKGYLRPTGMVLATYPPQFPHFCNNPDCDYTETFRDIRYPYIEYKKITPDHRLDIGLDSTNIATGISASIATGYQAGHQILLNNGWDGTGTRDNLNFTKSNNGNNF